MKKANTKTTAKSTGVPAKKAATKKAAATAATTNDGGMLHDFFTDELKDIYWAEKNLVKTLPKMQKAATTPELQQAFADHLETTKVHVDRLEKVFELLGKKAQAKKCDAMAGILEEGSGIIEETKKGTATRDVGLILAGQKVEHYEIATYGGLATLAQVLDLSEVAELLQATLAEEKEADDLLTTIAEDHVNYDASTEEEQE